MNYNDFYGMTNEEAVAYFAPITVSYVPCGDLENLLGWAGLAKRNAVTGSWEGSLIDFMNSNAVPALSDGLAELFSHLNKPRSVGADTHQQPWASKMSDLLAGLEAVGQVDAAFTASVIALAGGYAYPEVSVESVQLLRDEQAGFDIHNENRTRYDELHNEHIAALAYDATPAEWALAIQAMSDNFVA